MWAISALVSVFVALHFYGNHRPIDTAANMTGASQIVPYLKVNSSDRYLLGGRLDDVILYDFHLTIPWSRVVNDNYIKYPIPGRGGNASGSVPGRICNAPAPGCVYLRGLAAARAAIRAHWFAVVSFVGQNQLPIDKLELDTVQHDSRLPARLNSRRSDVHLRARLSQRGDRLSRSAAQPGPGSYCELAAMAEKHWAMAAAPAVAAQAVGPCRPGGQRLAEVQRPEVDSA